MESICLSGGAEGADQLWGLWSKKNEYSVIHYSFEGHNVKLPSEELTILTNEELKMADKFLSEANKALKRKWPPSNTYVSNLLRRNYFQIKDTDSVYAIGNFSNGKIDGGTAWAVQMYIDRFDIFGDDKEKCKLYFFDQTKNSWFEFNIYDKKWLRLFDLPPKPEGRWTGIGSRQLSEKGSNAIVDVMNRYPYPIVENPEPGRIIYIDNGESGPVLLNGGWATVSSVQKALEDNKYIHYAFIQELGNICFRWEDKLKGKQKELRDKYGLVRSYMKYK